jgi:hypothetical protein
MAVATKLADLVTKTLFCSKHSPGWIQHCHSTNDLHLTLYAGKAHVCSFQPGHAAPPTSSNLFYLPASPGNRQRKLEVQMKPVPSINFGFPSPSGLKLHLLLLVLRKVSLRPHTDLLWTPHHSSTGPMSLDGIQQLHTHVVHFSVRGPSPKGRHCLLVPQWFGVIIGFP